MRWRTDGEQPDAEADAINETRLRFTDSGAAGVVLQAAADPPMGLLAVVTVAEPVRRTPDLTGAHAVPVLKVVSRNA